MQLPSPFIPGCDLAGHVMAVGAKVRRFKVNDRVWGSNQGLLGRQGTLAELAAVDERLLYPIPGGVRAEDAAAVALVGITAHLGLLQHGKLRFGEAVFVRGGSGGVGSMVVQMAKRIGARVITTASTADKESLCRGFGADEVIRHTEVSLSEVLPRLAPHGVDLWWETLREPDFDEVVTALARRGRMILMAGREARPPFPVGPFYVKGCSLHGFAMFMADAGEQLRCAEDINAWLTDGSLRANIDRVMPLAQAAEAHRLQEENTILNSGVLKGKIVLKPSPS
jgi:NADPH2:quinone reductase